MLLLWQSVFEMIKIFLPDNHVEERSYIINLFFDHFLGLDYQVEFGASKNWEIKLLGQHKIVVEDHFFKRFSRELAYLRAEHIPQHVTFARKHPFFEDETPVLFGHDHLAVKDDHITLGIDIFAGAFFMLTRWEEYVLPHKDKHGRFPTKSALSYQFGFHHLPIVNIYLELLWKLLVFFGLKQSRKQWSYQLIPTHDVDFTKFWTTKRHLLKTLGGDLFKRKQLNWAVFSMHSYWNTKIKGQLDPYDTFDYLMDQSELNGCQAQFNFMSGGNTALDNHYDISAPFTREIIHRIKSRNHLIGFHPSYNSYQDYVQLHQEWLSLKEVVQQEIVGGRQHFLRFEVPLTWQILEAIGMKTDSSLGFNDEAGFRCGTCYEFPVFHFLERKVLKIMELPLTFMEVALIEKQGASPTKVESIAKSLVDTVRKYNGKFVFLWHNSSFHTPIYRAYQRTFERILSYAS